MIVIFSLLSLLHTPWLYTWDTCYTIPVKWFFRYLKQSKKRMKKIPTKGETKGGGWWMEVERRKSHLPGYYARQLASNIT